MGVFSKNKPKPKATVEDFKKIEREIERLHKECDTSDVEFTCLLVVGERHKDSAKIGMFANCASRAFTKAAVMAMMLGIKESMSQEKEKDPLDRLMEGLGL